jgi:hypothetical protein
MDMIVVFGSRRANSDSPSDPEEAATMVGCLSVAGVAPPCAFSA